MVESTLVDFTDSTDASSTADQPQPPQQPSANDNPGFTKASEEKENKKLKRKVQQAIGTICRAEDQPIEKLVVMPPADQNSQNSQNEQAFQCFVAHSGNGDEDDQVLVRQYCQQFDSEVVVTILPGINYGHVKFTSASQMKSMFNSLQFTSPQENMGAMFVNGTMRCFVFLKTHLKCEELKRQQDFDFPHAVPATTGSIPGLIVMKDFLTVEEEKELVDGLDSTEQSDGKSWEKLLNRRVKHFGYFSH